MPSIINATTTTGVAITGDNSGNLAIQTNNGNTAVTINTSLGVQVANCLGVGNATPSTSGAGITFPATQSASTDANTLDDYEEGTWTPDVRFGGANTGITYSSRSGVYTKIGRQVTVICYFAFTSKGSASGDATISGLPFVATSNQEGSGTIGFNYSWASFPTNGVSVTVSGSSLGFITGNGGSFVNSSFFGNGTSINSITATYFI